MSESGTAITARELLAFRFPPGSGFEGQLVGALERVESGGALRILGGLFVGREPGSGELIAVSMSSQGSAGMIGELLSFRLDPSARQKVTDEVLEGPLGETTRALSEGVEPGGAVAAVLVEHVWALALAEAISRIGGEQVLDRFIDAVDLADAPEHLTAIGLA